MGRTITIAELKNMGVESWSVKDNSPRGVHTAYTSELKPGDKVVIDNYFTTIIEPEPQPEEAQRGETMEAVKEPTEPTDTKEKKVMTYTAYWYRYPHGKETDPMFAQWRDFDDLEKAIKFIRRREEIIRSIYWAGAHVEDERGNYIFEITSDGEEYMWYDDIKEGEVTGKTERQKEFGVTDRGYLQGIVMNDFLANSEAFLAKILTLDPGEYPVEDLYDMWGCLSGEWIFTGEVFKLSSELSDRMPEYFSYIGNGDTGVLTVKNPSESVDQSDLTSPEDVNPSDEKGCIVMTPFDKLPKWVQQEVKETLEYFVECDVSFYNGEWHRTQEGK